MQKALWIFLVSIIAVACKKSPSAEPTKLIQNQDFPEGLKIDGHDFDSLVIENCTFSGLPLSISNADHVTVRNCTFTNSKLDGIKVGFNGEADHVWIENCSFKDIGFNGVDSHERAPNGTIINCTFENMATSQTGAAMGQPHHGIYWKGKNVHIEGNTFIGADQPFGNGISVRSSGYVGGNKIIGVPKNGIMYYSNHPGDDSLIIENNFLAYNSYGIAMASLGNEDYHNDVVIIRFNTIVSRENYSIYVSELFEPTTRVEIYGNYAVNEEENYIREFYELDSVYSNLFESSSSNFVDATNGDLHLTSGSTAMGYCAGLTVYPSTDFDGDLRDSGTLNAGADE